MTPRPGDKSSDLPGSGKLGFWEVMPAALAADGSVGPSTSFCHEDGNVWTGLLSDRLYIMEACKLVYACPQYV